MEYHQHQHHRNSCLRSHQPIRNNPPPSPPPPPPPPPPPSQIEITIRRPRSSSYSQFSFRGGQVFTSPINPTQQLNSLLDSSSRLQQQITIAHPRLPNNHPSTPTHSRSKLTKSKSLACLPSPAHRSQYTPSSPLLLLGCSQFLTPRKAERRKCDIKPRANRKTSLIDFNRPALLESKLNHKASSKSLNGTRFQLPRFLSKVTTGTTHHRQKSNDSSTSTSTGPLRPPDVRHLLPPAHPPPSTWRSSLRSHPTFLTLEPGLGPTETKRQQVIWELIQTECSYIQDLKLIISLFSQPVPSQPRRPPPKRAHHHHHDAIPAPFIHLVQNVHRILALHQAIHASLEATTTRTAPRGAGVAESYLASLGRFKGVYQDYLVGFGKMNRLIDQVFNSNAGPRPHGSPATKSSAHRHSPLGAFLSTHLAPDQLSQLRLNSLLLKPVQRLMKYPLFFKQLCELAPATHPDHAAAQTVYRSMDALLNELEECQTLDEGRDRRPALASVLRRERPGLLKKRSAGRLVQKRPPSLPRGAPLPPRPPPAHYTRSSQLRTLPSLPPALRPSAPSHPADAAQPLRAIIRTKLSCVGSVL